MAMLKSAVASSRRRRFGSSSGDSLSCSSNGGSCITKEAGEYGTRDAGETCEQPVTTAEECEQAALSMGLTYRHMEPAADNPSGCFDALMEGGGWEVDFNSHPAGNSDAFCHDVICKCTGSEGSDTVVLMVVLVVIVCCCCGACGAYKYRSQKNKEEPKTSLEVVEPANNPVAQEAVPVQASVAAAQAQFIVAVPIGVGPGQQVAVTSPDGQQMTVAVPAGCQSGATFPVAYTPKTQPATALVAEC